MANEFLSSSADPSQYVNTSGGEGAAGAGGPPAFGSKRAREGNALARDREGVRRRRPLGWVILGGCQGMTPEAGDGRSKTDIPWRRLDHDGTP